MTESDHTEVTGTPRAFSRRALLGWSGAAGAAGLAIGGLGGALIAEPTQGGAAGQARPPEDVSARLAPTDARAAGTTLPMGLTDRVPAFGTVLALDLAAHTSTNSARKATIAFMRHLARRADQASVGTPLPGADDPQVVTAAGLDLRSANLQITPAFGSSLLTACGLHDQRPEAMVDIPGFATDQLDPSLCDGDLLVQIGSEDPLKTNGAVQDVLAFARTHGFALRWSRPGFRSTAAAADNPAATTRNLMGHRDGTANPSLNSPLWEVTVTARGSDWMTGGSYLVARQILLNLETWFDRNETDRDLVIGRRTDNGAALGEQREQQAVDLAARTTHGDLALPPRAHIRLANPQNTAGARIYRRSWNFDDGYRRETRIAGLMFLAWQADPRLGFIPIQQELVRRHDALSEFATHVGSALFAAPARNQDDYIGQQLLEGS